MRAALITTIAALACFAQDGGLIRSTTRLVDVEVVVRAKGKPVEDLQGLNLAAEQMKDGTLVYTSLLTLSLFQPSLKKPNASTHDLKLTFTQTRLAEVMKDGFQIRIPLDPQNKPGSQIRLGVQERSTGRVGSLTLHLPQ